MIRFTLRINGKLAYHTDDVDNVKVLCKAFRYIREQNVEHFKWNISNASLDDGNAFLAILTLALTSCRCDMVIPWFMTEPGPITKANIILKLLPYFKPTPAFVTNTIHYMSRLPIICIKNVEYNLQALANRYTILPTRGGKYELRVEDRVPLVLDEYEMIHLLSSFMSINAQVQTLVKTMTSMTEDVPARIYILTMSECALNVVYKAQHLIRERSVRERVRQNSAYQDMLENVRSQC
jgi:hypothetical protein